MLLSVIFRRETKTTVMLFIIFSRETRRGNCVIHDLLERKREEIVLFSLSFEGKRGEGNNTVIHYLAKCPE